MGLTLNVFLSWSGDRAKVVAEMLRGWIPELIQGVECFVSSQDIASGDNWGSVLEQHLDQSEFGIICLTPENHARPWILFEAGVLAKRYGGSTRACPYLIGVAPQDLKPP